MDPLPKRYTFISRDTWIKAWEILNKFSPTVRVDLCLGGEPTLHPELPQLLKLARSIAPLAQVQITTNGTQLASGRVSYRELLDAGANIIYTDMYAPREKFLELAKASGYPFYEYYQKPDSAPSPWTYYGPHIKVIVLQEQPENWPKSRFRAGLLGTWYNHLDWEASSRFGLKPVTDPLKRRCNQPFIYVNVDATGKYLLCCQDNTGETSGLFGGVEDGPAGFLKFWYGRDLQTIRRRLREKDRASTSYCSRCCITFSRCDYKHWRDNEVAVYWQDGKWEKFADE